MHFSSGRRTAAAVIIALILPLTVPFAAFAQDDDQQDTIDVPAGTAVARIDAISGDVAIQRGDSNDTVAAVPNAPVLGADYVTTGDNGRAEVGFDGRSAVRLGENVQIRFSKLDAGDRQMQLAAGTIELRTFGDTDGQSAIDTPSISIVPRTAGSFRVSVDNDGVTAVTVREGRADIITPQGTQPLQPGTTLVADGAASNPELHPQQSIARDGFDAYNAERDHIYQLAITNSPYTNPDVQGIGDLNANGRWVDDTSYGQVWIPSTVAVDWAPYRDGSWAWEDSYGWTWVAREPWGWAPYHYGRWYYSNAYHHWAWTPPERGRVAWSPALVGFVGFSIGAVNVGIGFGNIGWVPLAPHEAFHPWWGSRGTTIVRNTTIINNYNDNTNVHYRNLQVNNAMTSVTRENFQSGRFNERVAVSSEQLRNAHTFAVQGALPIVPGRENLRFSQRNVAPSLAARPAFAGRSFAGRATVVTRTPFAQQQQSVSRVTHVAYRPEPAANNALAPERSGQRSFSSERASDAVPSYTRGSNDSWQRFNANRNGDVNRAPQNTGGVPAYARPAQQQQGAAVQSYDRRATPAYARPAYQNDGSSRTAPQNETRQTAPSSTRQAAPAAYGQPANTTSNAFSRFGNGYRQAPEAQTQPQGRPQYQQRTAPPQQYQQQRAAAPAYTRQAPPAYQRPAAAARPQPAARETHSSSDDHHRDR